MKRDARTGSVTKLLQGALFGGVIGVASLCSLDATADITVPFDDKGSIARSCTSFPSCRTVQTSHDAASQGTGVLNVPVAMTNAYYIFDLTHLAGTVTSATFELDVTDIPTFSLGRSVGIFDVTTPLSFFSTSGSETRGNLSGDPASAPKAIEQVLIDLGSGQQYGSFALTSTGTVSVTLDALPELNAALGGHFILGVHGLDTLGASLGDGSLKLAGVVAVPEPGTYAMLIAGLGVLGLVASRRKRQAA